MIPNDARPEKVMKWLPGQCSCWSERRAEEERQAMSEMMAQGKAERTKRLFDSATLGEKFAESRFETWEHIAGTDQTYTACKQMADEFEEYQKSGQGLLIFGAPGNGKSRLAASIVNAVLEQGKAAVFQSVPDLLERIKRTFNAEGETEAAIMTALEQADLLVLDDLGAEKTTEWTESKLYSIIDYRYRHKKPIVVTTNRDLKGKDTLEDAVGFRAYDRLIEMCAIVKNSGESYRKILAKRRMEAMR